MPKTISIMNNENDDDDFHFGAPTSSYPDENESQNSSTSSAEKMDQICSEHKEPSWETRLSGKHQSIIYRTSQAIGLAFQNKLSVHTDLMCACEFWTTLGKLDDDFEEKQDLIMFLHLDADELTELMKDAQENLNNIQKMADTYPAASKSSEEDMDQFLEKFEPLEENNRKIKQVYTFFRMFHSIYSILRNYHELTMREYCNKYLAGFPINVREQKRETYAEKFKNFNPISKQNQS